MAGILCGECSGGKGVSALLNNCVSCPNAQGLLILALSRFYISIPYYVSKQIYFTLAVIADAVTFVTIVGMDIALPGWVYPFIFYVQVDLMYYYTILVLQSLWSHLPWIANHRVFSLQYYCNYRLLHLLVFTFLAVSSEVENL